MLRGASILGLPIDPGFGALGELWRHRETDDAFAVKRAASPALANPAMALESNNHHLQVTKLRGTGNSHPVNEPSDIFCHDKPLHVKFFAGGSGLQRNTRELSHEDHLHSHR